MKNRAVYSLISGIALLVLIFFCACSSGGKQKDAGRGHVKAAKPVIDTSRVLETLELYRSKRYEGIEDALNDGEDHAFKLVLYGRELETLSPDLGKLTYLQTLDVAQNQLSELPVELSELYYLQGFYANGNRLTAFPDQLLLLPILSSMDLSENQIGSIPGEIMIMDQLTRLSMNENMLTSIPGQLYELNKLTILELGGNGLKKIPVGIDKLHELKKLDLSKNQLTAIPKGLDSMAASLKDLYIQGNQIPQEEIDRLITALPDTQIRF